MAKFKAGVFGVGDVSKEYIKAINLNPLGEVVAVVGRDKKKTQDKIASWGLSCETLDSYDDLVNRKDLDFIVNTGPHHMHAAETIKAAKAGKHIICEKPIGITFEDMVKVQKAVKQAGVRFQNGLALRWNPFVANMKRLVEKGAFGRIFYAEADYFHGLGSWWNGFTWGGNKKSGGPSASLVAGIHAADLLRYICGDVEEVYANQVFGHSKDFEYAPTYMAAVKFKSGAIGKTSCSFEVESPYLMNFLFHGSKGSVANKKFYSKDLFPGQTGWQEFETVMPDSPSVSHHPFRFLVDDFLAAVKSGKDTVLNIDETFKSHELCVAIDRSMETGEKVKLPLKA